MRELLLLLVVAFLLHNGWQGVEIWKLRRRVRSLERDFEVLIDAHDKHVAWHARHYDEAQAGFPFRTPPPGHSTPASYPGRRA